MGAKTQSSPILAIDLGRHYSILQFPELLLRFLLGSIFIGILFVSGAAGNKDAQGNGGCNGEDSITCEWYRHTTLVRLYHTELSAATGTHSYMRPFHRRSP